MFKNSYNKDYNWEVHGIMRLSDYLPLLGYQEYRIENEKEFEFLSLSSVNTGFFCCTFLDNAKYVDCIADSISMVLTTEEIGTQLSGKHYGICTISQPRIVFFRLHNFLSQIEGYKRLTSKTIMGIRNEISSLASIADNNVVIGNDVVIEEFVVIRENTIIGDGSIIRAGTVIGGLGFEFKHNGERILAVEHSGGVKIGQNVEIQYNSCIDRAIYPWDNTVIGDYVKIDNLVHIAHAVKIESNVMIAACSLIGGRVHIKNNVWVGASVTISNGLSVGRNSRVNIGAVATKNVDDGKSVTGNFAISHDKFISNLKHAANYDSVHTTDER